jgi:hypothetical protein
MNVLLTSPLDRLSISTPQQQHNQQSQPHAASASAVL